MIEFIKLALGSLRASMHQRARRQYHNAEYWKHRFRRMRIERDKALASITDVVHAREIVIRNFTTEIDKLKYQLKSRDERIAELQTWLDRHGALLAEKKARIEELERCT